MKPVLLDLGVFLIPSYHFFISLGMLLGIYVFFLYAKKSKIESIHVIDISLIIIISSYVGARLFHIVFETPGHYFNNPLEILMFWKGGFVIYGGILLPVLFIYLYCKRKNLSFFKISDILAPSVAIATALGRVACLMQGCCFGRESQVAWAIVFPYGANAGLTPWGIPLHPTQIYMSLMNLIIFLILHFRLKKRSFVGEITLWYFSLYAIGRSIVEFFRDDFRGDLFSPYLSTSQFISALVLTVSLSLLFINYRKNKTDKK